VDHLAVKPALLSIGRKQELIRPLEVTAGHDDVELPVAETGGHLLQSGRGSRYLPALKPRRSNHERQFIEIWSDPPHGSKELSAESVQPLPVKQSSTGARPENGVQNDVAPRDPPLG
jgi:hypothetical protein